MDSESSTAAKPSPARGVPWLTLFFVFLALVIAYPLSVGPVVAIYGRNRPPWLASLYAPVAYACENVPAVRAFYDWYGPLWRRDIPRS